MISWELLTPMERWELRQCLTKAMNWYDVPHPEISEELEPIWLDLVRCDDPVAAQVFSELVPA